nr:ribosomal protein L3 [Cyanidiaceae sp.]
MKNVDFCTFGVKLGMTQILDNFGNLTPVTVVSQPKPCVVTKVTTGLNSQQRFVIQIGCYSDFRANKPTIGYFKKQSVPILRYLHEFQTHQNNEYQVGQSLDLKELDQQLVQVSAYTIGKGFAGYQKRHKFSRGAMSHGSKNHKRPGSIGAGTTPGRVFPGLKMAGHLGFSRRSIKNLFVVKVDLTNKLFLLKGSVPGKRGNLLLISLKKLTIV